MLSLGSTSGSRPQSPKSPWSASHVYGLIYDSGHRRSIGRLSRACQIVCASQAVCGLLLTWATLFLLPKTARSLELILAIAMVCIGFAGVTGARSKSVSLLNLHVVAAFLTVLFTLKTTTELSRDVRTDCALAELHLRTQQLQEYAQAHPQATMMEAVHLRLNEVESLLGNVDARVNDLSEELHTRVKDIKFLRDKIEHLRSSAESVISSIYTDPLVTGELSTGVSQEVLTTITDRVNLATRVLQRLNSEEHSGEDMNLSYEEYVHLLNSLTEVSVMPVPQGLNPAMDPSSLDHAIRDLPRVKAAIERIESHSRSIKSDAERQDQVYETHRDKWAQHFLALIDGHQQRNPSGQSLGDMPEQCLKGQVAGTILGYVTWALVLLQGLSVYMAMTLSSSLARTD